MEAMKMKASIENVWSMLLEREVVFAIWWAVGVMGLGSEENQSDSPNYEMNEESWERVPSVLF